MNLRSLLERKSMSSQITRTIINAVLICSIVIGILGIAGIVLTAHWSDEIYNDNLYPLNRIYTISDAFSTTRIQMQTLLAGTSQKDQSIADINKSLAELEKQTAAYQKEVSTPEEKASADKISAAVKEFRAQEVKYIGFIKFDDTISAQQQLSAETADQFNAAVSAAFHTKTVEAAQRNQNNHYALILTVLVIVLFTVATILFSFRAGHRMARRLSSPIEKLAQAADSIAAGDLKAEIPAVTTDETSLLAASFKKIIGALRLLHTDVTDLVGYAEQGRLDVRADVSRHSGDYRAIVTGLNEMLDTMKKPLDDASAFLGDLAEGAHQEPLAGDYPGYYGQLVDNLNRVRDSVAVLTEETGKLAEAGSEGRLDVRGDATRVQGVYAQIVQGVNDTFDAFKAPLDVAAIFIAKMARGDNPGAIDNTYKGYYARIIDNLNAVRGALLALVGESQKLAAAGQEGDLSVRGDVTLVDGSFRQIVEGFNAAFEAIALPLQEAETVLGKMAVNDLTTRMSGNCKGMPLRLSNSINDVIDTLTRLQDTFVRLRQGDTAQLLADFRAVEVKSENDLIVPSALEMLEAIDGLVIETSALEKAALAGNLSARGDESKFQGSYRQLITGINGMLAAISAPIAESSEVLRTLAGGDLTTGMTGEYEGEYALIKTSLNTAVEAIGSTLSQISVAASQVSAGAKQVSDGSQNLSQGAVEQAGAIEELTSTVAEISAQTKQNARSAAKASELSASAQARAREGDEQMKEMLGAMQEISDASRNISKIIKTIDDIAFQTNILALNAAVEAARAGQYGKGFAVVAEEVRNLAGKSAEAARETTDLIEGSLSKVQAGAQLAQETSAKLGLIAEETDQTASLVHDIAEAANLQASSVVQVDSGLGQVSTVVQTNSATAEQSAAASEELSGQATTLQELIARFRLQAASEETAEEAEAETEAAGKMVPEAAAVAAD